MRTVLPLNSPASLGILRARSFLTLVIFAAILAGAPALATQTPATAAAATPAASAHKHKAAHKHKRPVATHAQSPAPSAAAAPATPPEPEIPHWPANEKPVPALVTWDSHGLRIEAANSSLAQILEDVASKTGTKVEGFDTDRRVFGVYGSGPASDVLSQLLHGTGYNVLLIGDQGQGTPREIILSSRLSGGATPAANAAPASASDEDADTDEQPQPAAPTIRPGFISGGPPHTPPPQPFMQQQQQPNNQPH
jgi:hypothetical protein